MKNHRILLLAIVLLTGSCGLIEESDMLPQKDNEESIKTDDPPAQGG
jgi:hypothetical protein